MEKITTFNNENLLQPKSELTLKLKSNKILKNISLLAMLFFLGFNSAISQSVDNPTKNKAIAVPDNGVFIKKSNKISKIESFQEVWSFVIFLLLIHFFQRLHNMLCLRPPVFALPTQTSQRCKDYSHCHKMC